MKKMIPTLCLMALLTAIVYNQMEGTADLISKPEMPVTKLGLQAAIDCFCDIPAFVRRYNEAAAKTGTYVMSDTFVQYIDNVCKEMEGK